MNKFEENRLTRYFAIRTAHDQPANHAIWSANAGYALIYAAFNSSVSVLEAYAVSQGIHLGGITLTKESATDTLVNSALIVDGALLAYATVIGDSTLEGKCGLTESGLRGQRDTTIGTTADGILQLAKQEMAKPIPVPPATQPSFSTFCSQALIDALEDAADAYDLLVAAPLAARANRKTITAHIGLQIAAIDRLIDNGLLALGRQFAATPFWEILKASAEIVNTGSQSQPPVVPPTL